MQHGFVYKRIHRRHLRPPSRYRLASLPCEWLSAISSIIIVLMVHGYIPHILGLLAFKFFLENNNYDVFYNRNHLLLVDRCLYLFSVVRIYSVYVFIAPQTY